MIGVVRTTMPQHFLDTGHIGMKTLQCLIKSVLGAGATVDHSVVMSQLTTVPSQDLVYHHSCC